MNKFFTFFLALILLPLSVQATEFKEGTHYDVLKKTSTEKPEVMEFFSFYCPHCLKMEPLIKTLKENLPSDVQIKKNHVDFIGREMGPQITQAYAAAEMLQVEEKMSELLFDRIQVQRKAINGESDILDLFQQAGIKKEEAKSALASFPVNGLASHMRHNTQAFKIRGVPTLIVNGKYKVNTGSVRSNKEFLELVSFLTKKTD